jgi:hypothetical protein
VVHFSANQIGPKVPFSGNIKGAKTTGVFIGSSYFQCDEYSIHGTFSGSIDGMRFHGVIECGTPPKQTFVGSIAGKGIRGNIVYIRQAAGIHRSVEIAGNVGTVHFVANFLVGDGPSHPPNYQEIIPVTVHVDAG